MEITSAKPIERKQAYLSSDVQQKVLALAMEAQAMALPFLRLSKKAAEADTFQNFPTSLMSVGKTVNDGNISIFTKDGVIVHKEQDVLITYKGASIPIGKRDERGRYRIPLIQQ